MSGTAAGGCCPRTPNDDERERSRHSPARVSTADVHAAHGRRSRSGADGGNCRQRGSAAPVRRSRPPAVATPARSLCQSAPRPCSCVDRDQSIALPSARSLNLKPTPCLGRVDSMGEGARQSRGSLDERCCPTTCGRRSRSTAMPKPTSISSAAEMRGPAERGIFVDSGHEGVCGTRLRNWAGSFPAWSGNDPLVSPVT